MSRGFVLGKFMPPHGGHMRLCATAAALVDELTILVCWLPDDPIPGPLRLAWMRELFPRARVVGHDAVVPQAPEEHGDFWPIWRGIAKAAHPEPIDFVFAGEAYGRRLAAELGAEFVMVPRWSDGVSGTAVRASPWTHWAMLPPPVRGHYARTICLHGAESTGKTMLAERLAGHFATLWVPEYGRAHCEEHGLALGPADLAAIAARQSAAISAARPWCDRRLFTDTDALTTAAWSEMLIGDVPEGVRRHPRSDLYLMLEDDVPWHDDGTRYFADPERRRAFSAICRRVLDEAGVRYVVLSGEWEARFRRAVEAVERFDTGGVWSESSFDASPDPRRAT